MARGDLREGIVYTGLGADNKPVDRAARCRSRRELLRRGQERFNIFCSPCHGRLGNGNGMIVQRGYKQPPSYHIERLRSGAGRLLLRRDDRGLRRHADLRAAGPGRGPLGDRRLHPRAPVQPERAAGGAAARRPRQRVESATSAKPAAPMRARQP